MDILQISYAILLSKVVFVNLQNGFYVTALSSNVTVKVGILLMTNSTFPVDLPRVGPAIDMGIEEVRARYGISFDPILRNYSVWCYKARYTAPGYMADMFYKENVRVFVGPACSYAVQTAGRMAEYLKVPMVTGLGDLATRNPDEKDMFETTTILSYNIRKLSEIWARCYKALYTAPDYMTKAFYTNNVRFFIGPACSYAVTLQRETKMKKICLRQQHYFNTTQENYPELFVFTTCYCMTYVKAILLIKRQTTAGEDDRFTITY